MSLVDNEYYRFASVVLPQKVALQFIDKKPCGSNTNRDPQSSVHLLHELDFCDIWIVEIGGEVIVMFMNVVTNSAFPGTCFTNQQRQAAAVPNGLAHSDKSLPMVHRKIEKLRVQTTPKRSLL
jgi:hypothetical protein